MTDVIDLSNLSIATAIDDFPIGFLDTSDLETAISVESFRLPPELRNPQFFIGVSTEEDGVVQSRVDQSYSNKLRFSLQNVDLCVEMDIKNPLISLYTESRDSTEWSILAQVRFRVGGGFNEEMSVVDADVFRFGPNAEPVTIQLGDRAITRLAIEMRYIYKARIFNFDIVPFYSSSDSPDDFDIRTNKSIELVISGQVFYPDYDVMALHNLSEFGRGNSGEYFPQMTIDLRNELAKNDLRPNDMIKSLLCFLHKPHRPIQEQFIRPLLIFAHVHKMPYLLHCMENAFISSIPITPRLLFEHFQLGDKYCLANLVRTSLLRAEGAYKEIAKSMVYLPDYVTLNSELRQAIAERMSTGWAQEMRRLGERKPTKNSKRIVWLKEGGICRGDETHLHSFADVHSHYAFDGSRCHK